MVVLLGRALGICPEVFLLVLLLFVSAAIEEGALLFTASGHETVRLPHQARDPLAALSPTEVPAFTIGPSLPRSYASPITPDAFLAAAKDGADLPYPHGRDKTAKRLGVSSAQAKRIVGRLLADDRIVVESKRLRLTNLVDTTISAPLID